MQKKLTDRAGSSQYVPSGVFKSPVVEARHGFGYIVPIVRAVYLSKEARDLDIEDAFVAAATFGQRN